MCTVKPTNFSQQKVSVHVGLLKCSGYVVRATRSLSGSKVVRVNLLLHLILTSFFFINSLLVLLTYHILARLLAPTSKFFLTSLPNKKDRIVAVKIAKAGHVWASQS